jgi:TonB family protein
MFLSKTEGVLFLLLGICFALSPGLAQAVRDETAAKGHIQHWLQKNTGGPPEEESPIFYVNKEDQEKILIFLGKQVYLLETKTPSLVRVTSALPKADGAFETGEIATEALRDVTATIQHVSGTAKFAGGSLWLGWSVCFQENGKVDLGHRPGCYMFVRWEDGAPPGEVSSAWPLPPPPPPRPVKRYPIKVGGNVQQSKLIKRVEPVYPELAKRARVEGRVVLVVTVDEEGSVAEIKVRNGHPLLYEAAVTAVRQWKYSPTLLNGEPVPVITTVTVTFSYAASGEPAISVGG